MKKIDSRELLQKLPPLTKESNKYSFGHVVIIGGNVGYAGAVKLCAQAALRSGSGLVTVLTRQENVSSIVSTRAELMVRGFDTQTSGINQARPILEKADAIVIGPGLGRDEWANHICSMIEDFTAPKVLDADALWNLCQRSEKQRYQNAIITPHFGEAARLLNCTSEEIRKDKKEAAKSLLQISECVVLKGDHSLIANDQDIYENDTGNSILAMAGTGDILAGIIGSFLGQGLSLTEAACLGTWVHGKASDLLRENTRGIRGSIASDLFPYIQEVIG